MELNTGEMALLKNDSEESAPISDENNRECVNDCQNPDCNNVSTTLFTIKEISSLRDPANNGLDHVSKEQEAANIDASRIQIKQEQYTTMALKGNSDNSDVPVASSAYSDHTYTSDGRVFKQEISSGNSSNSNAVLESNLKIAKPFHNVVKQEIKVFSQDGDAPVKEDVHQADSVNNIYIKRETASVATETGGGCNVPCSCAHRRKCNKCNASFVNKLIYEAHIKKCGFNGDSVPVPIVAAGKIPLSRIQKCNRYYQT